MENSVANLVGNSARNAVGSVMENARNSVRQGGFGKAFSRKAFIGGNLAFGMGDGKLTNQHPAQEIWWEILWQILWEMFWEISWETLQEMLWEILREILQDRMEGEKPFQEFIKAVIG